MDIKMKGKGKPVSASGFMFNILTAKASFPPIYSTAGLFV